MVDWYPCTIYVQHWLNIPLHILAYYELQHECNFSSWYVLWFIYQNVSNS
jgi:hypothetical protein